jgi:hypothetical protein
MGSGAEVAKVLTPVGDTRLAAGDRVAADAYFRLTAKRLLEYRADRTLLLRLSGALGIGHCACQTGHRCRSSVSGTNGRRGFGEESLEVTLPGDVVLEPMRNVQGFVLACLVDATTGMILGSLQDRDDMGLAPAAAGATDVIHVLSMMTGEMATKGDLEDVIVTLDSHYHLIRLLKRGPGRQLLLFVTVDRSQANLAMALREIRNFSAGLFTERDGDALVTAAEAARQDGR